MAGYIIDLAGHRWAFFSMMLFALAGLLVILGSKKKFSSINLPKRSSSQGGSLRLLFDPLLGRVLLVSTFISVGWDLQIFMFPIYGHHVGLSASEIGWLVGSFYTATLFVRFALPYVSNLVSEWLCLAVALSIISISYAAFPLFDHFEPLLVVAFCIGLGLGASTPNIMSLTRIERPIWTRWRGSRHSYNACQRHTLHTPPRLRFHLVHHQRISTIFYFCRNDGGYSNTCLPKH